MFDTYITKKSEESIPQVKSISIFNKRAPTDESIKLYGEMKQKAYDSILDSLTINDNTFNLSVILQNDYESYEKICHYVYKLNDVEYRGQFRVDMTMNKLRSEDIQKIYEDASKQIASTLCNVFLKDRLYK